jgi:hypothetical protein
MTDIWEGHGKLGVTEEADDSPKDRRWGRRRGLLFFLALLTTAGCDSSSSYRGGGYHPESATAVPLSPAARVESTIPILADYHRLAVRSPKVRVGSLAVICHTLAERPLLRE